MSISNKFVLRVTSFFLIVVCIITESFSVVSAKSDIMDSINTENNRGILISTDERDELQCFDVVCDLIASWNDYEQLCVHIRNTGVSPIDNWAVSFSMSGSIADIWDAYVCSNVDDLWLVRHNEYNGRIPVGGEVSFSMIVKKGYGYVRPSVYDMPIAQCLVSTNDYAITVIYDSQWDDGCSGRLTIENKTSEPFYGWTINLLGVNESFELWDFQKNVCSDGVCFCGRTYNCDIPAYGVISTGFFSNKEKTFDVLDISLSEIRTLDVADGLLDENVIRQYVHISDMYQVVPIYSMQQQLVAYLLVYFEGDEACSYAIVSNQVDSQEAYLMEFGSGLPAFCPSADWFENDSFRLIYVGGYTYFIQKDGQFWAYDGENIEKIDSEIIADCLANDFGKSDVQYYEYQKTLDKSTIYAKEVGYQRISESRLRNDSSYVSSHYMKSMSKIKDAYSEKYKKNISSHCGPSAVLNSVLLFKSLGFSKITIDHNTNSGIATAFNDVLDKCGLFFGESWGLPCWKCKDATVKLLKKYGYSSAVGYTYAQASWSQIKTCINDTYKTRNVTSTAVISSPAVAIVYLDDSQIYHNHFVLGTGYITFVHSTGWQSKYIQIFDQWDYGLRYVNYSLGINYISVLEIFAESGVNAPPVPTPAPTKR